LPAELVALEPWRCDESLLALNPAAGVPVLEDGELVVADSGVICEYLDEVRAEPGLFGRTIAERAETRRLTVGHAGSLARQTTPSRVQRAGRPSRRSRASMVRGAYRHTC
jgi:glutathione S-transferase